MCAALVAIHQHPHLPAGAMRDMLEFYESLMPRLYPWSRPVSAEEVREWFRELDVYEDFSLAMCYCGSRLVGLAWLQPSKVGLEVDNEAPYWDLCVDKLLARARWFSRRFGHSGRIFVSVGDAYRALRFYVESLVGGVTRGSSACMGVEDPARLCAEHRYFKSYSIVEARSVEEASRKLGVERRRLVESIVSIYNKAFSVYEWFTAGSSVEDYERWIEVAKPSIILAVDESKRVLGYLLYVSYVASDGVETVHLHEIAVDPSAQGRGIGTSLVRALACIARGKRIVLYALAEVEGFYSRLGFEVYARYARIVTSLSNVPSAIESIAI